MRNVEREIFDCMFNFYKVQLWNMTDDVVMSELWIKMAVVWEIPWNNNVVGVHKSIQQEIEADYD